MKRTLEIELPKGFMNCGITAKNNFVADTNDSDNWDTLKFPLPRGKWKIKCYKNNNKVVVLIDKSLIGYCFNR